MSIRWNGGAVIGLACLAVWGTLSYGSAAPTNNRQEEASGGGRSKRAVVWQSAALWPGGVVHYQFAPGTDQHTWDVMQNGMRQIEAVTAVRFVESATATNRLLIRFVPARQGKCGVSFVGRSYPQPQPLTLSCRLTAAAVHELMHALGFDHEERRGKTASRAIGNADPESIMHAVIEGSALLSQGDIAGINALYPRTAATPEQGHHPAYPVARDDGSLLAAPRSGEAGVYRLKSVNVDQCVSVFGRSGQPLTKPRLVELTRCSELEQGQRWRYLADGQIQSVSIPEVCLGRGVVAGLEGVACSSGQSLRWDARDHRISPRQGRGDTLLTIGTSLALGKDKGAGPLWYWEPEDAVPAPRAVSPDPVAPRSPFGAGVTQNPAGVILAGGAATPVPVPRTVSPDPVAPRFPSGAGVTQNPAGVILAGAAATPPVPVPTATLPRQLVSVADNLCLTARDSANTLKSLAMTSCKTSQASQGWRWEANGRIASAAFPGWCLGRVASSESLGRSGRGTASLIPCTGTAVVSWRWDGRTLQDNRFSRVGLSNINGWTALEEVYPVNPAWSYWRWQKPGG